MCLKFKAGSVRHVAVKLKNMGIFDTFYSEQR